VLLAPWAVVLVAAASTSVAAPVEVPGVSVPQVPVETPPVPLPPPPVAVPAPAPALPAPALPSPPAVAVPAPALPVPSTPSVSSTAYAAVPRQALDAGTVVETVAQGAPERLFGAPAAGARGDRAGRSRPTLFGTRYKRPRWLVRGLRGCLDEIPRGSRRLLVMRYGVGRFEPMPAATVARRLELSRREYGVARGRALRRLVRASRRSGCEGQRLTIAVAAPASTVRLIASLSQPIASAPVVRPAVDKPAGDVRGRSERGHSKDRRAPRPPAAVPPLDLASPQSDLPFLLALVGAGALFAWFVYRRARRSKEALDDH
jgi:hypothetical protein